MAVSSPQRTFAALNVAQLQQKLGELSKIVEGAAAPGADIDVASLGAAIDAKKDPVLSCAFERVSQEYARFKGDSETLAPQAKTIPSKDIKTVMSMLIASKQALADIDTNGDGALSREEVLEARHDRYADAGQAIASGAAFGGNLAQEKELAAWLSQTPNSREEISHRKGTYSELQRQVSLTRATPEGKRALTAHLQSFLLNQTHKFQTGLGSTSSKAMRKTLKSAERNFFVRLFGISKLDNAEISKLVGTEDLDGYAKAMDADVQSKFGASFAEVWLEGKDMNPATGSGFRFEPLPS